jgi:HK97 family phage prohead protease
MKTHNSPYRLTKTYGLTGAVDERVPSIALFTTDDAGVFEAVVSIFGNTDYQNDRVMPGAFLRSIEKWRASGLPVPIIHSHDWKDPFMNIGRADPKDIRELAPGEHPKAPRCGLYVRGRFDIDKPVAKQIYDLVKDGRIAQWSFSYNTLKERRASDGSNELVELELLECGPTLAGANSETFTLTVKAAPAFAPAQMTNDNSQWRCSCGRYGALPYRPTTALGERIYVAACSGCGRLWGITGFEKSRHIAAMREVKGQQIMAALKALADNGAPADVLQSAFTSAKFAVDDVDYTVADFKSRIFDLVAGAVDGDAPPAPPVQKSAQDRALLAQLDAIEGVGSKRSHQVPNEDNLGDLSDHLLHRHGNSVKREAVLRMNLQELQVALRAAHVLSGDPGITSTVSDDVSFVDAPKALSPQAVKMLAEFDAAERGVKSITDQEREDHERWAAHQHAMLSGPIDWTAQAEREAERQKRDLEAIERRDRERTAEADQRDAADDARRAAVDWHRSGPVDYTVESVGVTTQPVDSPRTPMPEVRIADGTVDGLNESIGALQVGMSTRRKQGLRVRRTATGPLGLRMAIS